MAYLADTQTFSDILDAVCTEHRADRKTARIGGVTRNGQSLFIVQTNVGTFKFDAESGYPL